MSSSLNNASSLELRNHQSMATPFCGAGSASVPPSISLRNPVFGNPALISKILEFAGLPSRGTFEAAKARYRIRDRESPSSYFLLLGLRAVSHQLKCDVDPVLMETFRDFYQQALLRELIVTMENQEERIRHVTKRVFCEKVVTIFIPSCSDDYDLADGDGERSDSIDCCQLFFRISVCRVFPFFLFLVSLLLLSRTLRELEHCQFEFLSSGCVSGAGSVFNTTCEYARTIFDSTCMQIINQTVACQLDCEILTNSTCPSVCYSNQKPFISGLTAGSLIGLALLLCAIFRTCRSDSAGNYVPVFQKRVKIKDVGVKPFKLERIKSLGLSLRATLKDVKHVEQTYRKMANRELRVPNSQGTGNTAHLLRNASGGAASGNSNDVV